MIIMQLISLQIDLSFFQLAGNNLRLSLDIKGYYRLYKQEIAKRITVLQCPKR